MSMKPDNFLILYSNPTAIRWGVEYLPIVLGSQGKRDLACVLYRKLKQPLTQQCSYQLAKPAACGRESPKRLNLSPVFYECISFFCQKAVYWFRLFDLRVTQLIMWWRESPSRLGEGRGYGLPIMYLCHRTTRTKRKDSPNIYIYASRVFCNPFSFSLPTENQHHALL